MEFVPLLVVSALIYALVNLVKMAQAGQGKEVLTQVVAWLVGIAVAFLLRASDFAETFIVGTGDEAKALSTLNPFSTVLVGVALAATANLAYDIVSKNTPTLGTGTLQD